MLPPKENGGVGVFVGLDAGEEQPSTIVSARPQIRPWRSLWSSAWCAQVTVVPEVSRISVLSSGRCQGSKTSMPCGGQCPPVKSHARDLRRLAGEQAGVEEGPEPGDEEHHLRGDEQDHAVAEVQLHDRRVVARVRFLDDVAPPDEHGVEDAEEAGERATSSDAPCMTAMSAERQREGRDRRRRTARARIDEVIVVVLGVRLSHGVLPCSSRRSGHGRRVASTAFRRPRRGAACATGCPAPATGKKV